MRFRSTLLLAFVRQAMPVTAVAAAIASVFLLGYREPLIDNPGWPCLFILVHATAVVWRVDAFHSSWFAFYRTRGFTPANLAWHSLLSAYVSALTVWALAALLLWGGLRAEFQDLFIESPYAPFLCRLERNLPLTWLAAYTIILPVIHYAMVRRSQPTRGLENGSLLAVAFAFTSVALFMDYPNAILSWIIWPTAGIYALLCLIASLKLHPRMEVRT